MTKNTRPKIVELRPGDLEALFNRLEHSNLNENDKRILKGSVQVNLWLRERYEAGKLSIYNLTRLLFGKESEKRKHKPSVEQESSTEKEDNESSSAPSDQSSSGLTSPEQAVKRGHGRLGSDAYLHAEDIIIDHPTLKPGDPCPEGCGGKLYESEPGVLVRVAGQNFAKVTRYHIAKLRCGLCGLIVTAELPAEVHHEKYDPRFKAILAVQKYFAGVPFYRQEHFQKLLQFPLPDATQWDLIEQVANCVHPVIGALETVAAAAEVIHNDDTPVRIIELMLANQKDPQRKRQGMFTTGIYARRGSIRLSLYYSGTRHAGENLAFILKKRPAELPPIIHMCDALSSNLTPEFVTLLGHCLSHGRRKFTDIDIFFPEECAFVIKQLGEVYAHDAKAKEQELSAKARLAYHQEHSAPILSHLKQWLEQQLTEGLVEPNSGLGKAMTYLLNHWQELTLFLRVAGAPLDNNVVEQALKIPIRLRKNSLNHLTCHGAYIAGILMSLIQTCRLSQINAVDYLTVLQENKSAVFKDPSQWLPWNYQETLNQQDSLSLLAA